MNLADTYGTIYLITHEPTGRVYVGQTVRQVKARFSAHARDSRTHLGRSIQKYGRKHFSVAAIETCHSQTDLDAAERFWIEWYASREPLGFNVAEGGRGVGPLSAEAKAKVSEAKRGVPKSAATIAKIVAIHKGSKRSAKARARMSEAAKHRVRVPHSAEARAKMSKAHTGRKFSAEHCANISAGKKGRSIMTSRKAG